MQSRSQSKADHARRTFVAAVLVIGLAGLPTSARAAGAEIPSDLAQAWADYDRATMLKDVAKLADLITDDYMLVNSDSSVQDRASYLADFRVPGFKLDPYEIRQPLQKMLGDSALTGGVFNLGWTQNGLHQHRHLRFVHVWSKQDGRWRIAYTQLTRIPELLAGKRTDPDSN
jgi:ketosteroid isomerase-like protein